MKLATIIALFATVTPLKLRMKHKVAVVQDDGEPDTTYIETPGYCRRAGDKGYDLATTAYVGAFETAQGCTD